MSEIPTMFQASLKKKPGKNIQDKVQVYQKEKVVETFVPIRPTMELHGEKKEEPVVELRQVPAKKVKEEPVAPVEPVVPPPEPAPVTRRVSVVNDTSEEQARTEQVCNARYQAWVDQQATKEEEQIVMTEAYKQERAAKRHERRASLEEKLALKEERRQKLEEKLAANKAVAFAQDLLKDNSMFSPEYRARVADHNRREDESRRQREEQKRRLEEKFGPLHEKLKDLNVESEEWTKEMAEKEAAWKAQKEQEKAEKIAKKEEAQRKKEEYERRRDARAKSPPKNDV